jgi:hypothetical protein
MKLLDLSYFSQNLDYDNSDHGRNLVHSSVVPPEVYSEIRGFGFPIVQENLFYIDGDIFRDSNL